MARTQLAENKMAARVSDAGFVRLEGATEMSGGPDARLESTRAGIAASYTDAETLLRAKAGIPDEEPAHTGEELERDIDEHVANIERWNKEDRGGR